MRKEYTDDALFKKNTARRHSGEKIKLSEYLMLWMYELLTKPVEFGMRDAVLYRIHKKFTDEMPFDDTVKEMDRLIREAEKAESQSKSYDEIVDMLWPRDNKE